MNRLWVACVAALLGASSALADEAKIRRVVGAALGDGEVQNVRPAPMPGLFEVHVQTRRGPQVLYTDEEANYIFQGHLFDARAGRDLTEEALNRLLAIDFTALPLDWAVKVERGNGRRVLAIFSDPYCPACRQFEQVLAQVDDITVYYFMYPVIRPELAEHSKAVWCSADRAKAWLALAARPQAQPPKASASCDTPVERILELGRSLGVGSTPTLFLPTGERIRGGLRGPDLVAALDEAARRTKRK